MAIEGQRLLAFDKKLPARLLLVQATVFFIGGIIAAVVFKWYIGLIFTGASPLIFWFARSFGAAELVITDTGIYTFRGKGLTQTRTLVNELLWSEVTGIKQVSKRSGSGENASTSHFLIFERGDDEPYRYLMGFKQRKRLFELAGICTQRGVPFAA